MLEHFETLRTWKFWVISIAIFLPIWVITGVLSIFIWKSHIIYLKTAILEATIQKAENLVEDARQRNDMIWIAKQQLEGKTAQLINLTTPSSSNMLQTNSELKKIKTEVSAIQPIPQDKFDQIQKDIDNLKISIQPKAFYKNK